VLPASSPASSPASGRASGRASGLTLAPASTQALVPSAAKKKTRAAARKRKKKGRTISSTSAASAAALQASAAAAAPSDTAAPASSSLLERECGLETPAFPEPSDSPPVELRPYQREAIDAVRDHLSRKGETRNPLVVLPPGAGKSLLVAEIIRSTMAANPSARVVVLAHTKELVEQNYDETMRYWPDCPAGVYQAALNKREGRAQVVFASIQSLYNNFDELVPPPSPDLILIDEAHLVPRRANKEDSRYGGGSEVLCLWLRLCLRLCLCLRCGRDCACACACGCGRGCDCAVCCVLCCT
jgi:Rad3-related DNA helicase